jgi:hypothetical protein
MSRNERALSHRRNDDLIFKYDKLQKDPHRSRTLIIKEKFTRRD